MKSQPNKRHQSGERTIRVVVAGVIVMLALFATSRTAQAATCTSNAIGPNNWSNVLHWTGCLLGPQNGDTVIIATATTLDTNSNAIAALTVNTGQTLTIGNNGTGRTLTVTGDVTLTGTGTITAGATAATHSMLIGGNLSNAGTFDGLPGAGRIINVTFNGNANQTVSGNGATTRFNNIIVNNTVAASIININSGNFTAASGFLTLTSGVFELSGTFGAFSNTFFNTASYTIPANAGLWINNPNVTATGQNGDATLNGLFRISQGTYNVGTAADNDLIYATGSTIDIQGGALNVTGAIQGTTVSPTGTTNTTTYSQSGGTVTVAIVNVATGAKSYGSFDIKAAGSSFTMSGGSIVLQNPTNVVADYVVGATLGSVTGGTLQVGNASTIITNPYLIVSSTPVFNLTVKATVSSFTGLLISPMTVKGDMLIETGEVFDARSLNLTIAGNLTNNGTFTSGTQTTTFNGSSGTQTIGGTSATAFSSLTISNSVNLVTSGSVASGATLTLNNDLATDVSNSIVLTATGATMAGTADVVGSVLRTDVGAAAVAFGNPNVQVTNGTAMTLTLTLVKQAPANFSSAVTRVYTLNIGAGTVSSATLRFHYLNAELQANTATSLDLYRATGSPGATWVDNGNVGVTRTTAAEPNNWIQQSGITGFSAWTLANGGQASTAVRLTRFDAASYVDGVTLNWQSGYEVNNLGYHIYREENGKRSRVTPSIVAGSALTVGPNRRLAAGFSYSWFDSLGTANTAYYLEAVDLNGSRETVGPIYPLGSGSGLSPKNQRALLLKDLAASAANVTTNSNSPTTNSWATALHRNARSASFKIRAESLSVQQTIAAGQAVKIQVRHSGWYHVSQAELVAAGLDQAVDARMLQLYADGEEVPIRITSEGSHLGANDALEFYGVGLDTPTTDTRTYWLVTGESAGKRISSPKRRKARGDDSLWAEDGEGVRNFANTTERREKLTYFPNLLNGDAENIFGNLVTTDPINESITVKSFDRDFGVQPQIEIALQGATLTTHEVRVQLNGTSLGTISFASQQHPVQKFSLNRSLLHEGDNTISLVASGTESDVSFVDWIRLTYARMYKAENNALQFSVAPGQTARVTGFTTPNVRVLDITNPDAVTELSNVAGPTGASYGVKVQTRGAETHTYLAFGDGLAEPASAVTANQPSRWNASSNGADLVIVTHKDFRSAVEPLANLRRSQGLSVAVVDVEDVYDEFAYGAHTAVALKGFLSWAASHWSRAPQYLLLVGDSSWDPRNYLDQGDNDFVPTKLLDTFDMETASDDWLADFNGDDLADMGVGRLPVRTAAEANLLVGKIMAYDQEREMNAPLRGAVMVSDRGFESQSAQTSALLPPQMTVETIDRGVVNDDNEAQSRIVAAIDQGPLIVNYYGHGSVDVWTGAGLLNATNARTLTNGNRLSLFVMMTCLNGYAHDAFIDSLAEAALKAENGGAMAVWASSGFTEPEPQFTMSSEFYRQLFGTQPVRLGEAVRNAKQTVTNVDVRRTWILLGDPSMRIR